MKPRAYLVLLRDPALGTDQDPDDSSMAVPGRCVEGSVPVLQYDKITGCRLRTAERTHVILHVWSAAVEEEDPTGLVVAALTTQVESCEAAPVLHVDIGLVGAEERQALTEPVLGRQVEGSHTINLVLVVHGSSGIEQEADNVEMTPSRGQLQS